MSLVKKNAQIVLTSLYQKPGGKCFNCWDATLFNINITNLHKAAKTRLSALGTNAAECRDVSGRCIWGRRALSGAISQHVTLIVTCLSCFPGQYFESQRAQHGLFQETVEDNHRTRKPKSVKCAIRTGGHFLKPRMHFQVIGKGSRAIGLFWPEGKPDLSDSVHHTGAQHRASIYNEQTEGRALEQRLSMRLMITNTDKFWARNNHRNIIFHGGNNNEKDVEST